MMNERKSPPDPFAGHTPIVRFPSVDTEPLPDIPDIPKPKKYSFRKKEKKSNVRTFVGYAQIALFFFIILLIAVFSYGFIYRKTFVEPLPLLGPLTNQVQRLAAAGRDVRLSFDAPVQTNAPVRSHAPVQVRAPVRAHAPVQVNASAHGDAPVQVDAPDQVDAPVQIDVPVRAHALIQTNATTRVANAPTVKSKRQIDPEMKRFYNGGRKGRTMGPKGRK